MKKYLELGQKILDEGIMIHNERTGKGCLTLINEDIKIDVGNEPFPMLTTKKSFWKAAVAEFLGYIKGLDNAADFRALGTKTWDANANETQAWLDSPYRKGEDDMGMVYGKLAKNWPVRPMGMAVATKWHDMLMDEGMTSDEAARVILPHEDKTSIDLFDKVYQNLKAGKDDRGEIITFYNPSEIDRGCLRPCMYEHIFSLVGDTLYLRSVQRSNDFCIGEPFNLLQGYFFLQVMAQITGHKAGIWTQSIVNLHIYEDHIELFKEQLKREPIEGKAELHINPDIDSLEKLRAATLDDFWVTGYEEHHPAIKYPFAT